MVTLVVRGGNGGGGGGEELLVSWCHSVTGVARNGGSVCRKEGGRNHSGDGQSKRGSLVFISLYRLSVFSSFHPLGPVGRQDSRSSGAHCRPAWHGEDSHRNG